MLKLRLRILWPPDVKNWLIGKDPDAGKDWGQEEKGVIEDEMVGWHQWLNGHELEQTQGDIEDREAWCAVGHGVAKSTTRLSDWTTTTQLLYNVVRVSAVQQSESAMHRHTSPFSGLPSHLGRHRALRSSLSYTVGSHQLSISCLVSAVGSHQLSISCLVSAMLSISSRFSSALCFMLSMSHA